MEERVRKANEEFPTNKGNAPTNAVAWTQNGLSLNASLNLSLCGATPLLWKMALLAKLNQDLSFTSMNDMEIYQRHCFSLTAYVWRSSLVLAFVIASRQAR